MVGCTYRSGPKSGSWRFTFCIHIAQLSLILSRMWQAPGRARIYCLQACQQERGRKSLSVDFAIQLAWRFIYPELLKFTRQGFVAHTARPHRVYQSRLGQLLPFMPNTCLAARFDCRWTCHWSRGLGVKHRILPNSGRIRLIRRNQKIGFLYFSRASFFGSTC